jgi:hypothetical protein
MSIKYLNDRECPECRSRLIVMLLRFSSKISTINGICGKCDYAMKWLIIRGKTAGAANVERDNKNKTIAPPYFETGVAAK